MARRSFWRLGCGAVVVLALLALPRAVLAGGVVVSLDADPPSLQAGVPFTIGFTIISMHGDGPIAGLKPTITATLSKGTKGESTLRLVAAETKPETVTVTAQPEGAPGHYVATLTLPAHGTWQWQIQPFGGEVTNYPASVLSPLEVRPYAVPQAAPAAEPAPVALHPALSWGLVAVVALAALGALGLLRTRRRLA